MKRLDYASLSLTLALALFSGCTNKPCATTSQCGSGEVCAAATCQALSCSSTYYAVDPSDGSCRPLPACGNRDDVRGWAACNDPCTGMGENDCVADPRCQPGYITDPSSVVCSSGDEIVPTNSLGQIIPSQCSGARTFAGCRANPLRVDPCAGMDPNDCAADSRCTSDFTNSGGTPDAGGCACAAGEVCNCPEIPVDPNPECRLKTCGDYVTNSQCKQHSECTTSGNFATPGGSTSGSGGSFSTGPIPEDQPFEGCFPKGFGSCFPMDEATCLQHSECHPVGGPCYCPPGATCVCGGGKYQFCEPDDGLKRCNANSDCSSDQRCNNDEACAPTNGSGSTTTSDGSSTAPIPLDAPLAPTCPGVCVPKGCAGDGEKFCVADPSCEPTYALQCSPYGGGQGGGAAFDDNSGFCPNDPTAGNGALIGGVCGTPCEPSFVACTQRTTGAVVDAEKSVLLRDPGVVDSPEFAFPQVMQALAGQADAATFVDNWFTQMTVDTAVGKNVAPKRPLAAYYMRFFPRTADGSLDLANLGFQVTSLSNRLDLATEHDCGEARITYAFGKGLTDRRHRMTIIVELKQPDDGIRCASVAAKWVALSKLSGDQLRQAAVAIYQPLLAPEHVGQVRTNEFFVGSAVGQAAGAADPNQPQTPWQLREWRLGADGGLHLAPSKQAVDPTVVTGIAFTDWLAFNSAAVLAQTAIVPDQYLAITSGEDGSRISLFDPTSSTPETADQLAWETALNQMACAGCHTTETNSAFVHVGERFGGTERAKISDFLLQQLPRRGDLLFKVSQRGYDNQLRALPKPVH